MKQFFVLCQGNPSSQKLLERYKAGDFEAVWQELKNFCEIHEQSVKDEALEIAREAIKRVKYNFHVIVNNLIKLGFEFRRSAQVYFNNKQI